MSIFSHRFLQRNHSLLFWEVRKILEDGESVDKDTLFLHGSIPSTFSCTANPLSELLISEKEIFVQASSHQDCKFKHKIESYTLISNELIWILPKGLLTRIPSNHHSSLGKLYCLYELHSIQYILSISFPDLRICYADASKHIQRGQQWVDLTVV